MDRTFALMKVLWCVQERFSLVAKTNVSGARTMEIATQAAAYRTTLETNFVVRDAQMNSEVTSMESVVERINVCMG